MTLLDTVTATASAEYTEFLSDQTDSAAAGDYVLLYGQGDLAERNETLEVQTYLPGWVAIGDDGGGIALLMRLDGSPAVYRCGQGALGSLEPEQIADSFSSWFAAECPAEWMEDVDEDDEADDE